SLSALAFLAGRPGRRPVVLAAGPAGVFFAAVVLAAGFFAAVSLAAVFLAAVFLAAVLLAAVVFAAGAPPSAPSPTFTVSESTSRVAATVLVLVAASSAASGETRVTFVIIAFRRRNNTGRARGHHSMLRKEGCVRKA